MQAVEAAFKQSNIVGACCCQLTDAPSSQLRANTAQAFSRKMQKKQKIKEEKPLQHAPS